MHCPILKDVRVFLPTQRGPAFISELLSVIPNAHYYKRGTYDLKKVLHTVSFSILLYELKGLRLHFHAILTFCRLWNMQRTRTLLRL